MFYSLKIAILLAFLAACGGQKGSFSALKQSVDLSKIESKLLGSFRLNIEAPTRVKAGEKFRVKVRTESIDAKELPKARLFVSDKEGKVKKASDAFGFGLADTVSNYGRSTSYDSFDVTLNTPGAQRIKADIEGEDGNTWTMVLVEAATTKPTPTPLKSEQSGGGSTSPPSTGEINSVASLAALGSTAQTSTVGFVLTSTFSAIITNQGTDTPMPAQVINWQYSLGGAMIDFGSSTSDARGVATSPDISLPTTSGTIAVLAILAADPTKTVSYEILALPGAAAAISVLGQSLKTAVVGTIQPQLFSVLLADSYGNPIRNAAIQWEAASGSLAAMQTTTDDLGKAVAPDWTLPTLTGSYSMLAKAGDVVQNFTVNATSDIGSQIAIYGIGDQTATVGSNLSIPFTVIVKDQYANPVPQATIDWLIGATKIGSSDSDNSGLASSPMMQVPTAMGTTSLVAALHHAPTQKVEFSIIGVAAFATTLIATSSLTQNSAVDSTLGNVFSVKASDNFGNPVVNASIDWVTATGTLTAPSSITDSAGATSSPSLKIGTKAGHGMVEATLHSNPSSKITFLVVVAAGAAASIKPSAASAVSINGIAASSNTELLQVIVQDAYANPIPNTPITWSSNAGSLVTPITVTTDADGIASAPSYILGTTAGNFTIQANSAAGHVDFPVIINPDVAASLTIIGQSTATGTVNSTLTSTLSILVTDRFSNIVPNAQVNWSISRGTLAATTSSNSDGITSATNVVLPTAAGDVTIQGVLPAAPSHPAVFSVTAVAGIATSLVQSPASEDGVIAVAGTTVSPLLQVFATDAYANPVANFPITWTASAGSLKTSPVSVPTDASGLSSVPAFQMGTIAPYAVIAAMPATGSLAGVGFAMIINPDNPAVIQVAGANTFSGTAHATLVAGLMQVSVRDIYTNIPTAALVNWSVSAGSFASATSQINSSGLATSPALTLPNTIPSSGKVTVTASLANGATASFTITVNPGTAKAIQATASSATSQSISVNTSLSNAYQIVVKDTYGNTVPNIQVNWAVGSLASFTTSSNTQTGSDGTVYSPTLLIGNTIASGAVTATINGTATSVSFTLNAIAGTASNLVFTQEPSNVVYTQTLSPAVKVTVQDAAGNTISSPNYQISLTLQSGSGLSGGEAQTTVNGVATFSNLKFNTIGAYRLIATSTPGGLTRTSSLFDVTYGLKLIGPSNIYTTSCARFRLGLTDASGNLINAPSALTVSLTPNDSAGFSLANINQTCSPGSSSSPSVTFTTGDSMSSDFYLAPNGWTGTSQITIQANNTLGDPIGYSVVNVVTAAGNNNAGVFDTNLNSTGTKQITLGTQFQYGKAIAQVDGKILLSGVSRTSPYNNYLARFLPDGSLDATFGSGGLSTLLISTYSSYTGIFVEAILQQRDGKILIAGHTPNNMVFNGTVIARILADGSALDSTFGTNGVFRLQFAQYVTSQGAIIKGLFQQSDGKLLVVADNKAMIFEPPSYSGTDEGTFSIVRLTASGAVDTTYNLGYNFPTGGFTGYQYIGTGNTWSGTYASPRYATIAQASSLGEDGTLVIAGSTWLNASAHGSAFVKISPSGTVTIFSQSIGGNLGDESVSSIVRQPDGKILAAVAANNGQFCLVRFTSALALDSTYGIGGKACTAGISPYFAALQPNGQLVVSTAGPSLRRYNVDGSLDSIFNANVSLGFSGYEPQSLIIQPNGLALGVIMNASTPANTVYLWRTWP